MVRALLAGTKMQTRRVMKIQPPVGEAVDAFKASLTQSGSRPVFVATWSVPNEDGSSCCICPYGKPGDLLWVRESITTSDRDEEGLRYEPFYRADVTDPYGLCFTSNDGPRYVEQLRWTPSIHMPRTASRLTLRITDVRVERLQEISKTDAIAEGLDNVLDGGTPWGIKGLVSSWSSDPRQSYKALWESINGSGSWNANPWVWCVSFEVIKANVDAVLRGAQ